MPSFFSASTDSPDVKIPGVGLRSPLAQLLLRLVTGADEPIGVHDLMAGAVFARPDTTVPEFCRALTDLVESDLVRYDRASRGYAPATTPAKTEGL